MYKIIITVLLTLFSVNSTAKCKFETYQITGAISSTESAPVANTKLEIEWQDYSSTLKKTFITDHSGRYQISIPFNTYSGEGDKGKPEDKCEKKLEKISLQIRKKTYSKKIDNLSVKENVITFDIVE